MKKKVFILKSILFILLLFSISVHADTKTITSDVSVNGDIVHIYGQIPDAIKKNQVTLLVCEDVNNVTEDTIMYIDQTTSTKSGDFEFTFRLPEDSVIRSYWYRIGTDADAETYTGTLVKEPVVTPPVTPPDGDEQEFAYMISGNAGDVVSVVANANNITSFEDRIFELNYNKEQVEVTSLYGTYFEDSLEIGTRGNIEIVSFQPGEIKFKIINKEIPTGKVWSGVLNIFKFKFNQNYSGNSLMNIR